MLWDASAIKGYSISGSDGSLGTVSDILFEDSRWTARWLVVDTGNWLAHRKVLLPISALGKPDPSLRVVAVNLTTQQVKQSPDIEAERPVSRQMETEVYQAYRFDPYWVGELYPISNAIAMPALAPPLPSAGDREIQAIADAQRDHGDPHLRSVNTVIGYHILATDGEIGHVEDFLFEGANWTIRYLKVDTKNWWRESAC